MAASTVTLCPVVSPPTSEVMSPQTTDYTTPATTHDSGGSAYYRNCAAARAAGVAPLHVSDPGYRRKLDRDGDGVACE
ncbi:MULTISPECIES: excalibur calcium-binding domain-containing protein [unclassified Tsukamurella]|uniref:excalibur calcium-binding domain-containing protein n=1 Tax=unclassified Tsukamurella TaxID=2633480 RepID=UPI0031BA70F0